MKHESGFKKTGQAVITEGHNLQSQIDQTMSSQSGSGKSMPAGRTGTSPKPAKGKVIPLRQEDIDLSGGGAKKRRLMIGLVVVLSIVMGLIITRSMGITFSGGQKPKKADSRLEMKNIDNDSASMVTWKVPDKISNSVRDITKSMKKEPELSEPEDLPQLSVRGIVVYNNNSKSAIVGDMIVKVGDTVKGVKIYKITADSVVFEKDGVRWSKGAE